MIIDIEPIIEKTNDETIRYLMELNKYKEMYVFRLENGENYSRIMTKKNFEEFVPSHSVSEMIKGWENSIKSQYNQAVKAAKTGLHPSFVDIIYDVHPITGKKLDTFTTVPRKLDAESKEVYLKRAKSLEQQFGKISFIKLV